MLMPFDGEFDDVYKLGIKQSCIDAGAYCERVDEQIYTESMLERIYNQISKADIIIADMTGRNPNVFYEVGYAHALGKTSILLTKNATDIPFDLKHYPHIIYENKITKLKEILTTKIKWCIENIKDGERISNRVGIDLYLGEKNLSAEDVEYITPLNSVPYLTITIANNSSQTLYGNDLSVGVITDSNYVQLRNIEESKTCKLPDGTNLHMYPVLFDVLFPGAYTSFSLVLEPARFDFGTMWEKSYKDTQKVTIRVYSPNGYRDFYLTISYKKAEPNSP